MRIAICFSGQIRTGIESSKNILDYLDNLLPNIDFFIHTWDIETTSLYEVLKYENAIYKNGRLINDVNVPQSFKISDNKINNYLEIYKPKKYKIDDQQGYLNNVNYDYKLGILEQYYSWNESNKLKIEYEKENNFIYDIVIKLRPDVIFSSKRKLIIDITKMNFNTRNLYVWRWNNICEDEMEKIEKLNYQEGRILSKLEDVYFLGNSEVMNIATNFVNDKPENFMKHIDRQILHYMYVTDREINIINLISSDFTVFRYFQIELQTKLKLDNIIKKRRTLI